jgi:hypothetical protein
VLLEMRRLREDVEVSVIVVYGSTPHGSTGVVFTLYG